ncbi:hypothetical protein BH11PLA2_BH11PLA2_30550 [soil metagenome]
MRTVAILFLIASPLFAQTTPRFQWKAGDVHTFTVEHDTTITETAPASAKSPIQTTTITTKLKLTRSWTVHTVDADGAAILSQMITAFRNETTRPVPNEKGVMTLETTVLDSATPDGAKAVAEYLNKPILTAKVDTRGRVSEVKAKTPDAASRLQAELPFRFECPAEVSTKWERTFGIKLDPPAGTGENFDALQVFTPGEKDTFTLVTSLKSPPKDAAELQPLLPFLWEGTVTFDVAAGQYRGSKLVVKKEIADHQGKGTKFVFESRFEESRVVK